ncbi:DNA polymerase/3'-5' exonuclease PolX [Metallumcola ferriviriculae]|uniref:DNA polymerase beta n=1 Tax=Metallumcola ferriviriculae TaxID=3039180 RepID=A0AAU0UQM1_9FIRM|nr:DNA polymerase/3'-5' exonuclease PolX [Desulfitibacteraceae bacterium MK1]
MTNLEVAWVLNDIAGLLEIGQDNVFKVRAYQKAARVVRRLNEDLTMLYQEGRLREVPGIGSNIEAKIKELLETGQCEYYLELRRNVPEILREMVRIPNVGVKSAKLIYKELAPDSLDDLQKLVQERKIRKLSGMGSKTELSILRGIDLLRRGSGETPLGVAKSVAEEIVKGMKEIKEINRLEIAGSVRRGKDMVGDVDIIIATDQPIKVGEILARHPQVREVLALGETKVSVRTWLGIQVDFRLVTDKQFVTAKHHFTGSKEHNVRLRHIAKEMCLKINEYGVWEDAELIAVDSEKEIYQRLGLQYIPPELREDGGEVEAAASGSLPELVTLNDIKGDLHLHTRWSDGVNTLEEMAQAAKQRGYQYMAITDHSRSLKIAGGLSIERLREQRREIDELNQRLAPFRIFAGVEADILTDGSLDYPDEMLREMDIVIASVHSRFRMEEDQMTKRIIKALSNPWVNLLAHPTGRLLGRRPGYAVNINAVLEAAKDEGKGVEINSSPDRLDLRDEHVRLAKDMGIPIVINTDAHDIVRLGEMAYGVITARRGWLEAGDVVNAWDRKKVSAWLKGGK